MSNNSTNAADAVNCSFEPDDVSSSDDASTENNAWLNDRLNEWFNE